MEKFSYETNGYNRREVNNFVNEVITQTEGIVKKCKEQRNEIEKLKEELKHYRNLESSLKDAIIRAEEAGDNIKRMAREESNMIVTDAKNNASRIVNEALLRAEKIEIKAETLENNIKIFLETTITLKNKVRRMEEKGYSNKTIQMILINEDLYNKQ